MTIDNPQPFGYTSYTVHAPVPKPPTVLSILDKQLDVLLELLAQSSATVVTDDEPEGETEGTKP